MLRLLDYQHVVCSDHTHDDWHPVVDSPRAKLSDLVPRQSPLYHSLHHSSLHKYCADAVHTLQITTQVGQESKGQEEESRDKTEAQFRWTYRSHDRVDVRRVFPTDTQR